MTPSVALRRLWEQLDSYRKLALNGARIDVFRHFQGPILPPSRDSRAPIGDPVFEAVAEYTSVLLARAGHLTLRQGMSEQERLQTYGKLTRALFTSEHALAIDLGKVAPAMALRARECAARATYALASYWLDRDTLDLQAPQSHPLLGVRPGDACGKTLYDHAMVALNSPSNQSSGEIGVDAGIGRSIHPNA